MVRWPSEAVGTGWRSTASEGHRTKPQISTGCSIAGLVRRASCEGGGYLVDSGLRRRVDLRYAKVGLDGLAPVYGPSAPVLSIAR